MQKRKVLIWSLALSILGLVALVPSSAFARGWGGGHGGGGGWHGGGAGWHGGGGFHGGYRAPAPYHAPAPFYGGRGWGGGPRWGGAYPGYGHRVYVPGYWGYRGGARIWIGGAWAVPPHDGWVWIAPRWAWDGSQWVWQAGYWSPGY